MEKNEPKMKSVVVGLLQRRRSEAELQRQKEREERRSMIADRIDSQRELQESSLLVRYRSWWPCQCGGLSSISVFCLLKHKLR